MSRIRTSRTAVVQMAAVNHVRPTVSSHFASVTLGDVVYFWAA